MATNTNIDQNIICKYNITGSKQEGIQIIIFQDVVLVNFDFKYSYHNTTNIEFYFKLVFIKIKPMQCELKHKKDKQECPSKN